MYVCAYVCMIICILYAVIVYSDNLYMYVCIDVESEYPATPPESGKHAPMRLRSAGESEPSRFSHPFTSPASPLRRRIRSAAFCIVSHRFQINPHRAGRAENTATKRAYPLRRRIRSVAFHIESEHRTFRLRRNDLRLLDTSSAPLL